MIKSEQSNFLEIQLQIRLNIEAIRQDPRAMLTVRQRQTSPILPIAPIHLLLADSVLVLAGKVATTSYTSDHISLQCKSLLSLPIRQCGDWNVAP